MGKNRYIVLLDNQQPASISSMEKEFSVSITSSENLSRGHRSFHIIDRRNAVLYRNLGAMVVDDADEQQLTKLLEDHNSPVVYFEKERDFFPADEMALIDDIKTDVDRLREKIMELESSFRKPAVPPPPLMELEWGLKAMGIKAVQFSGKGIDLCVLDTGFDLTHPDFVGREIEGKSFIDGEEWMKDPNGHGTHCAGIAAGNVRSDTGKRYGIAKDCNLKIGKVLADNGKGTTGSIIDAIDWAISKQCRVISLSLASPVQLNEKPSMLFEVVGNRALDNNCLIVAAAGNDSKRPALPAPVSAPANSLSIMAVAAVDSQMRVALFSNGGINAATGGNINVCAPGVDVLSAYPGKNKAPGGYRLLSGTSMATPHVSGLAALYMEQFPGLNAREIWELLESRAKPIENLKYRDIGNGFIQTIY